MIGKTISHYRIIKQLGAGGIENHHVNFSVESQCSKNCSKYLHSLKNKEEHQNILEYSPCTYLTFGVLLCTVTENFCKTFIHRFDSDRRLQSPSATRHQNGPAR